MQRIMVALAEMPVRALVTLGPSLNRADFQAPPNVKREDPVTVDIDSPMRETYSLAKQGGIKFTYTHVRGYLP